MVKRIALGSLLLSFIAFGVFLMPAQTLRADKSSDDPQDPTDTPTVVSKDDRKITPTVTPTVKMPPLFLAEIKNEVYVVHKGDKKKADPPQSLEQEDRIITGSDSKAYLEFESGGTIEIGPSSDVKVNQLEIDPKDFKARFLMAFGKMKTILHKLTSSTSSFEIESGGVVSGVRGTTFEVDYDKDKNQVATKTYEGSVFTLSNGKEQVVGKGFSLVHGKGGNPILSALTGKENKGFTDFLGESTRLDKQKDMLTNKLKDRMMNDLQNKAKKKAEDKATDSLSPKPKSGLNGGLHFGF
jgi:hypothetical protein